MIESADPRSTKPPRTTVLTTDPPVRPPPLLAVGPVAWVVKNLLCSWVDAIITLICAVLIVGAVTAFVLWAVREANWFVVSFNWRLLILGRYEQDAEWRIAVL